MLRSSLIARRLLLLLPPAALAMLAGAGLWKRVSPLPLPVNAADAAEAYTGPSEQVAGGRRVFHLGHSLVGRDMPAMLEQLAGGRHRYESQLGWGTTLKAHLEPDTEIAGFATENDHPRYRKAREALESGKYDAFVLTEMVEIRAAIRYFDSERYLRRWLELARAGNPDIDIFLYETWHPLDDSEGWLERIDRDLERYWQGRVLGPALAGMSEETRPPVHLIPGGQVMAAFVRRIENGGGLPGMTDRTDLFARTPEGERDQIHFNDHGAYLMALTHYAMLYARSPVGLPHDLLRADGTRMTALPFETAALMQEVVWEVVAGTYLDGPA